MLRSEIAQREKECEDRSKNVLFLKEEMVFRPFQEQPTDGRGHYNTFYQSPSLTSNDIFYRDFKGQLRPHEVKPLPEYEGEIHERHFRNRSQSVKRSVVKKERLFLFENQAVTG